jgi:hypothetical protein
MKLKIRDSRFDVLRIACLLAWVAAPVIAATDDASLKEILSRLERLEKQNQSLQIEVSSLRTEVSALRGAAPPLQLAHAPAPQPLSGPTLEERVAVTESRVEEQAQTKVEASQRFPIRLTGMALFNAFTNSPHNGGRDNPTRASLEPGPRTAGGTVRQSVIGLDFRGPTVAGGGKVSGSMFMDFYGGAGDPLNQYFRIRTASVNFDWKNTSLMVGQEKPIISPREPNSLAQVVVSPLTNAGNLWLWQPQVRIEQRFTLGEGTTLRAQAGVYQSRETASIVPPEYAGTLEERRPAYQGRFEFGHEWAGGFQLAIAPGVHAATSHVAGTSVASRMLSVDWRLKPVSKIEFTGMFFAGKNVGGMGALRQSFKITGPGEATAVRSIGGWSQLSYLATRRITFNLFGGQQDDRNSDLPVGGYGKNQAYGGNIMIRVAPNVILSFENLRTWTTYVGQGTRRNNHYDLAIAYQF